MSGMTSHGDDHAIDPWFEADLDPDRFRALGYRAVDMIASYFTDLRDLPVHPAASRAEVEAAFEEPLPRSGQDPDDVLDEWRDRVLPFTTHVGSPRYFGFVNGSGSMMAVIAEALAASVNMNPGAWRPAPAATEVERRCIAWLAEMVGYEPTCGGLLTSGGTSANLTALTAALREKAPYDIRRSGVHAEQRLRLYMADHEGHVSIRRAAEQMGLGSDAVRLVRSGPDRTMDVAALERAVDVDAASGDLPFCVVGQAGSINVGAVDPLEQIADVCARRGMWFHVDGASGAFGALLPELASLYLGLERADSITLDPHKWLYIPYECGAVLARDPERLRRTYSMTAPYLHGSRRTDRDGLDYLEYGPQMSRSFRALKLWMTIKQYGTDGYRRLLRQNIACAQHLHERVSRSELFEPGPAPRLFIYAFRFAPKGLARSSDEDIQAELDAANQMIADRIVRSGLAFLMTSRLDGRVVLRLSVCSHRTTLRDIDRVFEAAEAIGDELRSSIGGDAPMVAVRSGAHPPAEARPTL